MIRAATPADSNRAVALLRDSHAAAGFDRPDGPTGFYVPFTEPYAMRLFISHLSGPRALALVFDDGGGAQGLLLAEASEHRFGPAWIARETAWWIDPAHRGMAAFRMLDRYEAWVKERRFQFAGMAGMGSDPDVAKLYLRRGYRLVEQHYLKVL